MVDYHPGFEEFYEPPLLAKNDWVNACEFYPSPPFDVLEKVLDEVVRRNSLAMLEGKKPVVVFDLDSTLYDVSPRTLKIIREWQHSEGLHVQDPILNDRLNAVSANRLGYSLWDTFLNVDINQNLEQLENSHASLKKYWGERFFSNEYLKYDVPYPGAKTFVNKVKLAGAEVVFLTGRDEPGMKEGTVSNLKRDGFVTEQENTVLLMKENFKSSDSSHKIKMAPIIRLLGPVVASFENEPQNLVELSRLFPGAMHIFVDTLCSDRESIPVDGIYKIPDFSVYSEKNC